MDNVSGGEWDIDGEAKEPVLNSTAVQSVRFPLGDLKAIREAARQAGVTTSEFIREAAVGRARGTSLLGASLSYGSEGLTVGPLETSTEGIKGRNLAPTA